MASTPHIMGSDYRHFPTLHRFTRWSSPMMLDQNEDSAQLAAIKKKYGFCTNHCLPNMCTTLMISHQFPFMEIPPKDILILILRNTMGWFLSKLPPFLWQLKTPYLRESFQKNGKKVTEVIADTLPNTMVLAIAAIFIAITIGISLGILSALYKDRWIDKLFK